MFCHFKFGHTNLRTKKRIQGSKPPGFSSATVTASPSSLSVGAGPPPGLPPLGNVKQVHELEAEMDGLGSSHSQFAQVRA